MAVGLQMMPRIHFLARIAVILLLLQPLGWSQNAIPAQPALSSEIQELREQIKALQAEVTRLRSVVDTKAPATGAEGTSQAVATAGSATEKPETAGQISGQPMSEVSDVRAARYVDWQGARKGINLGDRVRFNGYGSMRFEANDVPSGNNIPGGSAASFTFRRFVLATDARPASRLRVYSEIEFERLFEIETEKESARVPGSTAFKQTTEGNSGGEISVEQAWGQFNFAENHGLRAGVVLVPVGRFNLLHDDDYWDIPRRTLTDRDAPVLPIKTAWRDLGAGLTGSFNIGSGGKLDYQIYALNGAALDFNIEHEVTTSAGVPGSAELVLNSEMQLASGFFDGSKSAAAFAWRASYSPTIRGEFALSGYHGKYAPSFVSFREALTTLAYDHKWRWHGFETEAEAVYTSLGNVNRVIEGFGEAVFNSASSTAPSGQPLTSATVETELANLSRRRYGFWTDFKYHARPAWLKKSFLGRSFEDPQLIPILRYERVWLNGVVDGVDVTSSGSATDVSFTQEDREQERVTLGISYRPIPQFTIQGAYEHNRRINGSRLIFPDVDQSSTNGMLFGMAFAF